ncbi:MAG: hypothetical protein CFE21_04340 [Bacteroidetes bacterium B1(2017)]|nr:MAG: hypothetical protein CFE21_04340 [Bacteroidetes bacterium B1(2017)]
MGENRYKFPLQILLYTLLILLVFSFSQRRINFAKFGVKPIDILADIRTKPSKKKAKFLGAIKPMDSTQASKPIEINKLPTIPIIEFNEKGKQGGLENFVKALIQLKKNKKGKVRIGYFGDSMIEGDLITQDLRQKFQDYFGGDGVGFVPITSVVAAFRQTIRSEVSDNWKEDNFLQKKIGKLLPPSGHSFYAEQNSWASFASFPQTHLGVFHQATLWYGPADSVSSISYLSKASNLLGKQALNSLVLAKDTLFKKIKIEFNTGNTPVYGVSFESNNGVYLDNYSFRGICGTELMKVNRALLSGWSQEHPFDLIVLHYGPNLLFKPEQTDFSYYKKQMDKTIKYLKSAFPNTSILIVSSADKAYRNNGTYETAPGVEPLVLVQQELAKENQCAFWNLYLAMGGENAMVRFAEEKPILAHQDYTHFNLSGSHWVARRLNAAIMQKYYEASK